MEVYTRNIGNLFLNGGNIHYAMPHFQRPYAWDEQNWKALLDDVFEVYESSADGVIREHFMGALVVVNEGTYRMIQTYKLVDGQQRLTTVSLLLRAFLYIIADTAPDLTHEVEALLINKRQEGHLHYKLLPTLKRDDRAIYQAVVDGRPTNETDSLIDDAASTLREEMSKRIALLGDDFDAERLYGVITQGLYVVFIEIKQSERPYEIFESLNAKGKPLTQTDLVRNYIAMRLPLNEQEHTFDQHWSYIDNLLDDERTVARIGEMTAFLRHYLAMRTGQLYNEDAIYQRFRERMEREFKHHDAFIGELQTLRRFAQIYDNLLRPDRENDTTLRDALKRLNIFESTTAYPVLLYVFDAHHQGMLSRDAVIEGMRVIENYLVRRALVGETQYANRMFPGLIREIDLDNFAASLRKLLSRRRYIPDTRLRETLLIRPVYTLNSRDRIRFLFEEINRRLSDGTGGFTVLDGSATIEHIMPQTLTSAWRDALGPDADKIQAQYVHTLGNLTLVNQSWNSVLSNSGFSDKRPKLSNNALRLNRDYFGTEIPDWNADAIRVRTEWLLNQILMLWPSLSDAVSSTQAETFKNTTPTALILRGEKVEVNSWRDVTRYLARLAWDEKADFVALSQQTMNVARGTTGKRWFQLPDSWAVYFNLDANSHMNVCRLFASSIGLHEGVDWWVEVERY